MTRTQTTLASLLLVQVVLILLIHSPFSGATSGVESRSLLPALEAFTATRLKLLGEEDRKVTLIKESDGWALEELGGFPADEQKIDDLLDDLRGLKVRRPVVSGSRYHAAFKVGEDDNEGRVQIWDDPSGNPEVDLIVGSSPNYRSVHVRLVGENPVYEVRDLASYELRADSGNWIEKDLVDVPETELVGLSLSNEKGSFELLKEDGRWRAAGAEQELDAEEVDELIRTASSIQLADAVGPKDAERHGLSEGAATLTLRFSPVVPAEGAEGAVTPPSEVRETVVIVGGKLEEKESQRFISRADFEFTGAVWESSVQTLLERTLEELLAEADETSESAG
jgi:hypothetical protein